MFRRTVSGLAPRALKLSNTQSGHSFKNVWTNIAGGMAAFGAITGALSIGEHATVDDHPSYPPVWFQKAFVFGSGAAIGGFLGGAFGTFVAFPIAYAAKFPRSGAVITAGVAVYMAHKHRHQLFGAGQATQAPGESTSTSKSVNPKRRP